MPQNRTSDFSTTKNVVLVVCDGVEALDVTGPASVFAKANAERPGTYRFIILSRDKGEVRTECGVAISSHASWSGYAPQDVDTLIIVGGQQEMSRRELVRKDFLSWVDQAARTARRVAGICTGVFVLANVGLLTGRRCTTHLSFCDELQSHFPSVEVVRDQIFVQDGKAWSTGGATTSIDLALALVEDDLGRECAVEIARVLVLSGIRVATTPQASPLLNHQVLPSCPLRDLLPWIQQNLANDLSADILAARAAMGVRNLNRMFVREFGITPHSYVLKIRQEYAALLLLETDWTIDEVARKSGFVSTDSLQRGFKKRWGITPGRYREQGRPYLELEN